jgi:hypothetical protein
VLIKTSLGITVAMGIFLTESPKTRISKPKNEKNSKIGP